MGKTHKQKGYRLENAISKKGFIEFRKMLGMPQFEMAHENNNLLKIQALQIHNDNDDKWINTYKPSPEVKLQKYLLLWMYSKVFKQKSYLSKFQYYLNQS